MVRPFRHPVNAADRKLPRQPPKIFGRMAAIGNG
jgi:hypothetical protein